MVKLSLLALLTASTFIGPNHAQVVTTTSSIHVVTTTTSSVHVVTTTSSSVHVVTITTSLSVPVVTTGTSSIPVVTTGTSSIPVVTTGTSSFPVVTTITSSLPVITTGGSTTSTAAPPAISIFHQLHPDGVEDKCMVVKDNNNFNGAPVVLGDCATNFTSTFWSLGQASTDRPHGDIFIQLDGTNFCLDGGSNPANGDSMKIWECFGLGLPAQNWFYTDDNRVALTGQGFCVDLENGNLAAGTKIQLWKCTDFNTNQIWTV